MGDDQADRVRRRAYQIWQEEGEPLGRDREHWARAERELGGTAEMRAPEQRPAAQSGDGEDASRSSDAAPSV